MSDSLRPHVLYPTMLLCPWDSSSTNTGVHWHYLLQGTFLTQGLNLGLLHCRQILYHLSHQGSPSPFLEETANNWKVDKKLLWLPSNSTKNNPVLCYSLLRSSFVLFWFPTSCFPVSSHTKLYQMPLSLTITPPCSHQSEQ